MRILKSNVPYPRELSWKEALGYLRQYGVKGTKRWQILGISKFYLDDGTWLMLVVPNRMKRGLT